MDCFVAWVQYNDYDTEPSNIGVYSSKEKAENAIIDFLRDEDEAVLSLEIYKANLPEREDGGYRFGIDEFKLDE